MRLIAALIAFAIALVVLQLVSLRLRRPGLVTELKLTRLIIKEFEMDLKIDWLIPDASATQSAITQTRVEMRADPSLPFQEVANVVAPTNTVTLPNLAAGHYEVRARGFDGQHFGQYSQVASIDLAEADLVPGQITGLTLTQV